MTSPGAQGLSTCWTASSAVGGAGPLHVLESLLSCWGRGGSPPAGEPPRLQEVRGLSTYWRASSGVGGVGPTWPVGGAYNVEACTKLERAPGWDRGARAPTKRAKYSKVLTPRPCGGPDLPWWAAQGLRQKLSRCTVHLTFPRAQCSIVLNATTLYPIAGGEWEGGVVP